MCVIGSFSRILLSFNWEWFLFFFFLLLCVFRRNSYLLWFWRAVYMWGRPCVAPVGFIYLVPGLFLVWIPVSSFLSVCWLFSPC